MASENFSDSKSLLRGKATLLLQSNPVEPVQPENLLLPEKSLLPPKANEPLIDTMIRCREKANHPIIFHNFHALSFTSKFFVRLDFRQLQHRKKRPEKDLG